MRYCKSTIFQANHNRYRKWVIWVKVVCDTAKVRFFKQITTSSAVYWPIECCLRYCKSTIFQANHNTAILTMISTQVVCDTAKVRFFKQITTDFFAPYPKWELFAILQKYDFSSKSQRNWSLLAFVNSCLRYCKSTIFQANHNSTYQMGVIILVVCDTAKVRFFKQITTRNSILWL